MNIKLVPTTTKCLKHTLQTSLSKYHHLSHIVSTTNHNFNIFLCESTQHGTSPSPYSINKTISLCAKSCNLYMGTQLHSMTVKMGFGPNVHICSALVDMYGKCGEIENAQRVFDEMPERNTVTWNCLMSGYLDSGCPDVAVGLFLRMFKEGVEMSASSVSSVLVGCSQLGVGEVGVQVHGVSVKMGFDDNVVVGTGLVDMYSKNGDVESSHRVFWLMPERNVITWTCMVTGYAQNQHYREGMVMMKDMLCSGYRSNYVAYNSLLGSFSSADDFIHCKQIHCRIFREGLESNIYIGVSLVTAYSGCGCELEDFQEVVAGITKWDQVSWNAVIAGFSNLGHGEEALRCFSGMREAGIDSDYFTFTSILKAIGIVSALEEGEKIHALVFKTGNASNVCVQNGLVSMYARCGTINIAKMVFSSMRERDLVSWNSLISGCAHHGLGHEAVQLFDQMKTTGVEPDNTTFLALLTACSHAGMLSKALECFDFMRCNNFPQPLRMEHYASIADLLGRSGNLDEAEAFINNMPIKPGPSVYKTLLSACQVHGNKEIAQRTAKKLRELYPNESATYILMANVLAAEGYWDNAAEMHDLMGEKSVMKKRGFSRIEFTKSSY